MFTQAHHVGMDAPWRSEAERFTHWDLIARILANAAWNPIWLVPHIHARVFRIDWLHCADQGCVADYMGNLLWMVQLKLPGRDHKARVLELWMKPVGGQCVSPCTCICT